MLSVYSYNNFKDLMRDQFQEKKKKNPSFSLRGFAFQLGLKSHGPLQQVLAGERLLPKKYLSAITKSFGLTKEESTYVEALIDFEKAKSPEEKVLCYEKLKNLRPRQNDIRMFEIESYKFFDNPLHSIILTLAERVDFEMDEKWIQNQLRFKVSQNEIKQALELILDLSLIKEVDGKFTVSNPNWGSGHDVPSVAVRHFHQKMSLLASQEIDKQSLEEREFSSMSLNLKKEKIPAAKEKIRRFIEDFMKEFDLPLEESSQIETYHLNTQLFALTKNGDSLENINH